MSDFSMSAYARRLILENQSLCDEIERLKADVSREQKQNVQHVLYYSSLEKTNADLQARVDELEAELEEWKDACDPDKNS